MINPLEKHRDVFTEDLKLVDQKILSISKGKADLIHNLVEHILASGGKRLRPIMLILSAKLFGNKSDLHVDMAACVELFHTATLFHDDVVDKSKMRRGKKTANEIWGNSASVLVGDFLLAQAFAIMTETRNMELIDILSKTSSIITEGEVKQLMHKRDITLSYDIYLQIINAKTAELFAASCRVGGVVAGVDEKSKNNLEEFGRNLGIAFQIADDALDYSAEQSDLGKKLGDDFREGKVTLPIINAYQNANADEKDWLENLFSAEEDFRNEKQLSKVIELIKKTSSHNYAVNEAKKYSSIAAGAINDIDGDPAIKEIMLELLSFSIGRKF